MKDTAHWSVPKPGEIFERQEHLAVAEEQPDPVKRDSGNLNLGNVVCHAERISSSFSWIIRKAVASL
jgi:hypothetical protein